MARRLMLEKALALAAAGHRIFPLKPNSKTPPIIENWREKATTDPVRIRQWWTIVPDANIGLVPQLALDFDMKDKQEGAASLDFLEMIGLPDTWRVTTPSGGLHMIYSLPPGITVPNSVSRIAKNVDVRGYQGYVAAAGSTIDGKEYVGGQTSVTEAPQWLIELCGRPREKQKLAVAVELDTDQNVKRATDWLVRVAPEAIEGAGGDNTTYQVCARMRDFGVSEEKAFELVDEHWNDTKAIPPWDPEDLRVKVENAYTHGTGAIGGLSAEAEFTPVEIPARKDTSVRKKLFRRKYNEAKDRALQSATNPLIKNLLDAGAMSVMYGDSGTGKTFVALDLAYHVAAGVPWNGLKVVQGPVIYVAAEAGEDINARIEALDKHYSPDKEPPLDTVPCLVDLFRAGADLQPLIALVREAAKEYGRDVSLIVIDTLARAMGAGDENQTPDMNQFVRHLDLLRTETGAHVMIVHHTGKDKARGGRGSSALRAATDTELEVADNKLTAKKQRARGIGEPVKFKLRIVPIGNDEDGERVTSCVVDLVAGGRVPTELTGEQKEWQSAIEMIVAEACDFDPERMTEFRFKWDFACPTITGKAPPNHAENAKLRNKLRMQSMRVLHALHECCTIEKGEKDQWFISAAQVAQNWHK
jgi:hypothetical protein